MGASPLQQCSRGAATAWLGTLLEAVPNPSWHLAEGVQVFDVSALSVLPDIESVQVSGTLHLHLEAWRKQRGFSQEQLADLLGTHKSTVSRWESGERSFDLVALEQLAAVYGVDPSSLLRAPNNQIGKRNTDPEFVALRLRALIADLKFKNVEAFADFVGTERSTASGWLNGRNPPRVPDMARLCEKLGLTLDWIYRGVPDGLPMATALRLAALVEAVKNSTPPSRRRRKPKREDDA